VNRSAGNPVPDEPWPVSARNLLSRREQSLYQRLVNLYPDHKILVQVALSQLINVDRNHPESESIRARYKQLVADFVLCRPDLSVVVVIELDDRSHERPKRQAADARKNKALADAGIRLVRIPAGRLPSEDALRTLLDADGVSHFQEGPVLSLAEPADTCSTERSMHGWRDDSGAESRELRQIALKAIVGAILFVGGWIIFSQVLPTVVNHAFQSLAPQHVRASSAPPRLPVTLPQISTVPMVSGASAEAAAEKKRDQMLEAAAEQKRKEVAWAAFYSTPTSCEHPADWSAQVECGNQYIRAKKVFDQRWLAEHSSSQGSGAEVVLNNASVVGPHK
jgi:Protein of unknown function (DUF2726)